MEITLILPARGGRSVIGPIACGLASYVDARSSWLDPFEGEVSIVQGAGERVRIFTGAIDACERVRAQLTNEIRKASAAGVAEATFEIFSIGFPYLIGVRWVMP